MDLSKIPLVALSVETKTLVSTMLNPKKWLPTDDGVPRDWRGLVDLCDFGGETIPCLHSHSDPTGHVITIMEKKTLDFDLKYFQSILSKMDRWDVIDDAHSLFERDAEKYLERMERCKASAGGIVADNDKQILTIDDLYRSGEGLDEQRYDAFLLYSDQDMDFVTEIIENLEKRQNLKLCIKDRDLIGGITFEHEAVMQLISERCNRLIVVVSPNFIRSSANVFFLNYAQAVGIEMRQRKIIPCLYKKCQLPEQLRYTFILDYRRVGLYDFWGRLRDSVIVAAESASSRVLSTQQSLQNEAKILSIQNVDNSKSPENIIGCADATNSPLKKINDATSEFILNSEPMKSKKAKTLISWPKRRRETRTEQHEKVAEPETEIISLTASLPSLDKCSSSLDIMKSTSRCKSARQKRNFVGSCVRKVRALIQK